jgi:addiction module HigA family antidote
LLVELLRPLRASQYFLAKQIGVPLQRINEIVHGQRRITAVTALRLGRFVATSERFWINLQPTVPAGSHFGCSRAQGWAQQGM